MSKLITFIKTHQADIILIITVILISATAFNLGKASALKKQKTPITIAQPDESKTDSKALRSTQAIASKNSTAKVYHLPWCSGASKISEKNKIIFATEAAAISAGYTLAGNCKK